jgi:hypothetical protein
MFGGVSGKAVREIDRFSTVLLNLVDTHMIKRLGKFTSTQGIPEPIFIS